MAPAGQRLIRTGLEDRRASGPIAGESAIVAVVDPAYPIDGCDLGGDLDWHPRAYSAGWARSPRRPLATAASSCSSCLPTAPDGRAKRASRS